MKYHRHKPIDFGSIIQKEWGYIEYECICGKYVKESEDGYAVTLYK